MEDQVRATYAEYLAAFQAGNAERVASFYDPPSLFVSEEGTVLLADAQAAAEFFANVFDDLRARDYGRSEVRDLAIRFLSPSLASVGGRAIRYARDGSVLESLDGLYTMRRGGGAWKFVTVVVSPPTDRGSQP